MNAGSTWVPDSLIRWYTIGLSREPHRHDTDLSVVYGILLIYPATRKRNLFYQSEVALMSHDCAYNYASITLFDKHKDKNCYAYKLQIKKMQNWMTCYIESQKTFTLPKLDFIKLRL